MKYLAFGFVFIFSLVTAAQSGPTQAGDPTGNQPQPIVLPTPVPSTSGTGTGTGTDPIVATPITNTPNANQAAGGEQTLDYAMGGVSMAAGGALIAYGASHQDWTLVAVGAMLVEAGIQDVMQGNNRDGAIQATQGDSYSCPTCSGGGTNPNQPTGGGTGGGGGGTGGGGGGTSIPAPLLPVYNQAMQSIPAGQSLDSLGGGGGGGTPDLSSLPQDAQDVASAAAKDFLSKYKVSSVPFESAGGGGRKGNNSDKFDLDGLLKNMNRGPASVEGLQKNYRGDAIGVAGDNIFKQVSRRYNAKKLAHLFLPPK